MFVYALNKEVKKELISKGYKMRMACTIKGNKAYVFENTFPEHMATFSKEHTKDEIFVSNVAYFV